MATGAVASPTRDGVIDARLLCARGTSRDPDAGAGRAVDHFTRGDKLFTVLDAVGLVRAWEVRAMNRTEPTVAQSLYRRVPTPKRRIIGDGMPLHTVASEQGLRHYSPLRQNKVGRRQQPRHKQQFKLWSTNIGRQYLKRRDAAERSFGHMNNIACGFKGLPSWVRRQPRVER